MTIIKLQFRPGINKDITNYSGEGGWWDGDKVRFRLGFPQKIGGWEKDNPNYMHGACRQLLGWTTTYGDNFLGAGTNNKLYIEKGGTFHDITPLRTTNPTLTTPTTDNCIATTNGSTVVTINITGHAAENNSFVTISGAAAVGGVPATELNANHKITVVNANSFTINVTTAATSTVAAGGGTAITVNFELEPGFVFATEGYGWGTSTWGRDTWGLGSSVPVLIAQRDWFLDHFDNDLIANIREGAPYYWARGASAEPALSTRAIRLSAQATTEGFDPNAVPVKTTQLMVSQQDKHLIAFGSVPYGSTNAADFDPLLIRWADQDSPANWTPSLTTSAGDLRVSRGSRIVRAVAARQEILVFTDSHVFSLQFLGTTDVFGLQEYADNISIASPRAVATAGSITVWMGKDKFYVYTGRVDTLPCTLSEEVFGNFNLGQAQQVVCGTNEKWDEIWWFYPSGTSDWNNNYVVFNYAEQVWFKGTIERTAWLDSPLRDKPLGVNSTDEGLTSYLYAHETGTDADGAAMTSYIESNDFDVEEGDKFVLTQRLIPDIKFTGSTAASPQVTVELKPRRFPGGAVGSDSADTQTVVQATVGQFTEQVFIRVRARQMAFKLMSQNAGVHWRLGSPRVDGRLDGRR